MTRMTARLWCSYWWPAGPALQSAHQATLQHTPFHLQSMATGGMDCATMALMMKAANGADVYIQGLISAASLGSVVAPALAAPFLGGGAIIWPWIMLACFSVVVCAGLLLIIRSERSAAVVMPVEAGEDDRGEEAAEEGSEGEEGSKPGVIASRILYVSGCLIVALLIGMLLTYQAFIIPYAAAVGVSKEEAVGVSIAFGSALLAGCVAALFISARLRPRTLLLIHCVLFLSGALCMMLAQLAAAGSALRLWLPSVLIGLGISSSGASTFTLLGRRIVMGGKTVAGVSLSAGAGLAVMPVLAGAAVSAQPTSFATVVFVTGLLLVPLYATAVTSSLKLPDLQAAAEEEDDGVRASTGESTTTSWASVTAGGASSLQWKRAARRAGVTGTALQGMRRRQKQVAVAAMGSAGGGFGAVRAVYRAKQWKKVVKR
eukprot:PLAT6901.2.p1 GENE.PLAT6901.2~~PLAT6901.2.p1  ORF type:complete len:431 (+),score=142.09 PLAT6901.2:327-1619(+)